MRIEHTVSRGAAVMVSVDGAAVPGFEGETIATAMLAQGLTTFRRDGQGQPRGLYCNMGTCCECMVTLKADNRRVRACVTEVAQGMEILRDG